MAFIGRGNGPIIGNNEQNSNEQNNNRGYRYYGRNYWYRRCYYIPLDNTYVLMSMIVTFLILIAGVVTYLFGYKSNINDPIEDLKSVYIYAQLIMIFIVLVVTLLVNFTSKNEDKLIRRLAMILAISLIALIIMFCIKLNLDKKYSNSEIFEQFYQEQELANSTGKSIVGIGISGISIETESEYYVSECMEMYNIFKIKTYGFLCIHLLLNILLIYQISRLSKIQLKKDRVDKDDIVLFDEEQNIKI